MIKIHYGGSYSKLAEDLGVSRETVRVWLRKGVCPRSHHRWKIQYLAELLLQTIFDKSPDRPPRPEANQSPLMELSHPNP